MKLQMLKRALIAYVTNSAKAIWSAVAHPLTIVGKKNCDVADYRIYGNSVQNGEPTPDNPVEVQSVGELTTKNLLDKDNVTILRPSSVTTVKRIETGIALVVKNTSYENLYAFLDLGLMSDYEGQTVQATMEFSRVGNEKYTNNLFVIYDEVNDKRTNLGTLKIEGNKMYLKATIGTGYTTERLTIRLYAVAGDEQATGVEYSFNNFMVYTGEEKLDYEPYHKYKVPITVRGKNLLNIYSKREVIKGYLPNDSYTVEDGVMSFVSNWFDVANNLYGIKFNVKRNTDYTLSYYQITGRPNISILNAAGNKVNKRVINGGAAIGVTYTSTFNSGENEELYLCVRVNAWGLYTEISNVMIIEGEGYSSFEPYIEPQTVNIYLDEPLDRVPYYSSKNIVDYIDSAKSAVVKYCYREIYDGTENWAVGSTYPNTFYKRITHARTLLCSHYKMSNSVGTDMCASASNSATVYITDSRFSTVEEFKAYLAQQAEAGTPVTAVYLKYGAYNGNPTEEPIELPTLPQFKGTTVYEAQTEIPPSGIEVQYYG